MRKKGLSWGGHIWASCLCVSENSVIMKEKKTEKSMYWKKRVFWLTVLEVSIDFYLAPCVLTGTDDEGGLLTSWLGNKERDKRCWDPNMTFKSLPLIAKIHQLVLIYLMSHHPPIATQMGDHTYNTWTFGRQTFKIWMLTHPGNTAHPCLSFSWSCLLLT